MCFAERLAIKLVVHCCPRVKEFPSIVHGAVSRYYTTQESTLVFVKEPISDKKTSKMENEENDPASVKNEKSGQENATPPPLEGSEHHATLPPNPMEVFAQALRQLMSNEQSARITTPETKPRKIDWSLIKTLCPRKLDSDTFTSREHQSWERGFKAFMKDCQLEKFEFDEQLFALETAMETRTFQRIDAMRKQLKQSDNTDIKKILALTKQIVEDDRYGLQGKNCIDIIKERPNPSVSFILKYLRSQTNATLETIFVENANKR